MAESRARKVILVVDDDPDIRELVAKALGTKYDVKLAADGLEASELLGSIAPPELIICDVMMPKVDGFSLVRTLKSASALHAVPVVFLTAKSAPQAIVQGIQLGAKHYIQKPFRVRDLIEKVDKILA